MFWGKRHSTSGLTHITLTWPVMAGRDDVTNTICSPFLTLDPHHTPAFWLFYNKFQAKNRVVMFRNLCDISENLYSGQIHIFLHKFMIDKCNLNN